MIILLAGALVACAEIVYIVADRRAERIRQRYAALRRRRGITGKDSR